MILTCPHCSTRFKLEADILGLDGKRVKCTDCQEIWFQEPDPEELRTFFQEVESRMDADLPEEEPRERIFDIPEGVKPLPERAEPEPIMPPPVQTAETPHPRQRMARRDAYGYAAAGVVFVLILVILLAFKSPISAAFPASSTFYTLMGFASSSGPEGLVFDRVEVRKAENGTVEVDGQIVNLTKKQQTLPDIEISLLSAGGELVASDKLSSPTTHIESEGTLPLKAILKDEKDQASKAYMRFVVE